jgi:integrase
MKIRKLTRRERTEWVLDYYVEGRRVRRWYRTKELAEAALQELSEQERSSGRVWLSLTGEERTQLTSVFSEVRAAGLTLRQVWEGYRNGTRADPIQGRTLRQAIDETVAAKTASNLRPRYVDSLRIYLDLFARGRETLPVDAITVADIERWFSERREAPSTKASNLGRLSALFALSTRRSYCTENPCERVERVTVERRPPAILTPEQTANALSDARQRMPRFVPWLALALFAGIRPEELDKLRWSDVDLKAGIVTIDAAASKVRQRRIVQLMPVAREWLKLGGDLPLPQVTRRRCIRHLRGTLGFEAWPQDILRHTAASYLLAHHQDAGKVAAELGNSAGILLRHYKELVPRAEARKFWNLTPAKV